MLLFKSVDEMPEVVVSKSSMNWNKTGSWRSSTPLHKDKIPPCNFNCPAGENIRGYIDLIKKNKIGDAFILLTEANPMPAVCGRVCFHPCQANCNRQNFDIEIQVRLLEKFIGDWALENIKGTNLPELNSQKIAVIGGGPAGLSAAYYLRQKGLEVTIYDENGLPGGILHYGIPSYRLEKNILRSELSRIMNGIEFKPNMRFGRDFDIGNLLNYKAVFLATGAHFSKKLNVPGENYKGVVPGLEFLKKINSGDLIDLKDKTVVVIGGGNTACDVARTAFRLGARVHLIYRRTEKEMPAFAEEIEQLKSEPIKIEFLAAPERIESHNDNKLQIILKKMKLGEPDESGRCRPIPIEGSDFEIVADKLYTSIGEDPDLSFFQETGLDGESGLDFTRIDRRLRDKLFIGGDLLQNPRTVAHAIGSGRLAAQKIELFVKGEILKADDNIVEIASPEDVSYHYFSRVNSIKWKSELVTDNRISSADKAIQEADRCFSCGVCNHCDNCYNFCPDLAVIKSHTGYQVNLDYCKGCGICANECPGGSLQMEEKR